MKTKIMTMATLVTLLTPNATSSGDPLAVEHLNIRFLNGNSDLGKPNTDIYGITDTTKYTPKIDLIVGSTGERIYVSAAQQYYPLQIAIPANTTLRARVTNGRSMKKKLGIRINANQTKGNLFETNTVDGNTAHVVFRMIRQPGPSVHFALYPQTETETNKQVKEECKKDRNRLKKLGRSLNDGESVRGFFRVSIPYTKPKKRTLDSDEASKKRTKTEE